MLVIKAGQVNRIPLPSHHGHDHDTNHGTTNTTNHNTPSAVQLIGVLKMRKPSNFDLQSVGAVKRAAASEGGASSGGYLLSSLALDPHSLIISSTAPVILNHTAPGVTFNMHLPPDAIPSYKGDSFDVEYVVVEKRLSDGHLEMAMAVVKSGVSMSDCQCRILYSRDCPAVICDPQSVTVADVQQRLRGGLEFDDGILKVLHAASNDDHSSGTNTLQYSIKDNEERNVAVIRVQVDKSTISSIDLHPRTAISKLHVEVSRVEAIDDLFSTSDSTAVKQKLVYRRAYGNVDFAESVSVDHLPELCIISTPMFKIYHVMQVTLDDAFTFSISIR